MTILTVTNGQVLLGTSAVQATDTFQNGVLTSPDGVNRSIPIGGDEYSNGLFMTDAGQVRYTDATDGLPADTTWTNGLPTSGGALCVSANAAATYSNGMPMASTGGIAAALVGSVFNLADAAFSLMIPEGSTYTGPLIRVRRSSDNAEQDIGAIAADANGNRHLNIAALRTFIGENSAFVTTWYDQTGAGLHMTQATPSNQPRIANAGAIDMVGGRPALYWLPGSTVTKLSRAIWRSTLPIGVSVVAAKGTGAGNGVFASTGTNTGGAIGFGNGSAGLSGSQIVCAKEGVAWIPTNQILVDNTPRFMAYNLPPGVSTDEIWVDTTRATVLGGGNVAPINPVGEAIIGCPPFPDQCLKNGYVQQVVYSGGATGGITNPLRRIPLQQKSMQAFASSVTSNVFGSTAAAYAMRIPSGSTYNGPLLRVRRSSDNTEQDINAVSTVDGNGDRWLDTVALLAFVGANNGFVTAWYDQTAGAKHAVQATQANQPRIVNSGVMVQMNGRPAINFTPTSSILTSPLTVTAYPATLNVVGGMNTATNLCILAGLGSGGQIGIVIGNASASAAGNQVSGLKGGVVAMPTNGIVTPNISNVFTFTQPASGASAVFQNGAALTISNGATTTPNTPVTSNVIGTEVSGSVGAVVQEVTNYNVQLTPLQRVALERSQGAAFGVAIA
jgi:Alpha-L-arabinofuranosidase B, catalytic